MTSRSNPVDHLVTAVELEISAILAGKGADGGTIALRDGYALGAHDAGYDYVFSFQNWHNPPGSRFLVRPPRSRKEWARASSVSVRPDGKLRLTTTTDLGENLATMQLRIDETASLELLAGRITSATEGAGPLNTTTASWILGDGSPKIGRCTETGRFVRDYENLRLNTRQRLGGSSRIASNHIVQPSGPNRP